MSVSLTRQYELRDGDIWQTNLVAHYPAELWERVRERLVVRSCGDSESCAMRCVYADDEGISRLALGDGCTVTTRPAGAPAARRLESLLLWSYDAGRQSWSSRVSDSAVLDAIQASRTQVLGYEIWHGSVE